MIIYVKKSIPWYHPSRPEKVGRLEEGCGYGTDASRLSDGWIPLDIALSAIEKGYAVEVKEFSTAMH